MAIRRKNSNSVKTQARVRRRPKLQIKWGRNDWVNKLEEGLMHASFPFYMAQLEQRHGRTRMAHQWMLECRENLSFLGTVLIARPLIRSFDRKDAYRQSVRALKSSWSEPGRSLAQTQYDRANKMLKHKLNERDTHAFFAYAAPLLEFALMAERKTERLGRSRKPQMRRSRA